MTEEEKIKKYCKKRGWGVEVDNKYIRITTPSKKMKYDYKNNREEGCFDVLRYFEIKDKYGEDK
jgi:hypothetical protein